MIQITEEEFKELEIMFAKETGKEWIFATDEEYINWLERKVVKNNAVSQHVVKSVCEHDYEQVYCESYYECRKCGNMSKIG